MRPSFASSTSHQVIERLEQHGYEAVFVGGAIRDDLLGKQARDIDIATSAEPSEVQRIFSSTIDVGIKHGTVLVLIGQEPIEVTTYRTGKTASERKTLREDLLHRDFTMNALAMTKHGELIDFFGGQEDLKQHLIRAVGKPKERFQEDALRLLRAVRFASVLNFTIEGETFAAMKREANKLKEVAIERIKIELDKLFLGKNPSKGLQLIIESELNRSLPLFPKELTKIEQLLPFNSSKEGWAILMLAGGFTAREMGKAYKLSNDEKSFLSHVEQASINRSKQAFAIDDFYRYDAIVLYLAEKFYNVTNDLKIELSIKHFEQEKSKLPIQSMKDLQVNGQDLLKWANVRGGRWVGEWMQKIEQAVLHRQWENETDKIKEWFIHDFNSER